jgi:hypothetical protein
MLGLAENVNIKCAMSGDSQGRMMFCERRNLRLTTHPVSPVSRIAVLRLATGWTVWGSNPGGGEIFRIRPDRPWDLPSLL